MAIISKAGISTEIWDTIRGYLNNSAVTNNAALVSAYAKSFTKDASNKDFVVVHKPSVTEEMLTFTKKSHPFTIDIEIVVSEEEQMKVISDAVRARIEANRVSARGVGLYNLMITGDDVSYETRDDVRILHNMMTLEGVHRGTA